MDSDIDDLIAILNDILEEKKNKTSLIKMFQEKVWDLEESNNPMVEILSELAYDLDYYEPDPKLQKEDSAYYGDERLKQEVESAIYKTRH